MAAPVGEAAGFAVGEHRPQGFDGGLVGGFVEDRPRRSRSSISRRLMLGAGPSCRAGGLARRC